MSGAKDTVVNKTASALTELVWWGRDDTYIPGSLVLVDTSQHKHMHSVGPRRGSKAAARSIYHQLNKLPAPFRCQDYCQHLCPMNFQRAKGIRARAPLLFGVGQVVLELDLRPSNMPEGKETEFLKPLLVAVNSSRAWI